jgi:hypothetical protein
MYTGMRKASAYVILREVVIASEAFVRMTARIHDASHRA